jgi:hypothetical protein
MSIAAVSSSFVAAVREVAPAAAVDGPARRTTARAKLDGGCRECGDLPQHIDALATAALSQPEVPPQPSPLTTTTAAVHLMQVPSSHLVEAFAALRQAIGDQADVPAGSVVNLTA